MIRQVIISSLMYKVKCDHVPEDL